LEARISGIQETMLILRLAHFASAMLFSATIAVTGATGEERTLGSVSDKAARSSGCSTMTIYR
jgi:nucleotide-binding universal stress UspA family protein